MIYKTIIKPKLFFDWETDVYISHISVDHSNQPEFTGLFDSKGYPLYKFNDPIGY